MKPRLFSAIARILDWSQLVKDQLLSMMIFITDDGRALGEEGGGCAASSVASGGPYRESKRGSTRSRVEGAKRGLPKPKECRLLES